MAKWHKTAVYAKLPGERNIRSPFPAPHKKARGTVTDKRNMVWVEIIPAFEINSHAFSERHSSYKGQTLLKTAGLYLTWKKLPAAAEYCHWQAMTITSIVYMHCYLPYLQHSLLQQQDILGLGYPSWLCGIWWDLRIWKWALLSFLQKKEVFYYLHVYILQYLEGEQIMLIL